MELILSRVDGRFTEEDSIWGKQNGFPQRVLVVFIKDKDSNQEALILSMGVYLRNPVKNFMFNVSNVVTDYHFQNQLRFCYEV